MDALCTAQLQLNFALTQKLQYFIGQVKMLFDRDFQRTFVQVNGTIWKNSKCISSNAPNSIALKNTVILNCKHASHQLRAQNRCLVFFCHCNSFRPNFGGEIERFIRFYTALGRPGIVVTRLTSVDISQGGFFSESQFL